ncbi:hypothetical protein DRO61_07300, partial [Candidatus Bathyarchaeota archaeon]
MSKAEQTTPKENQVKIGDAEISKNDMMTINGMPLTNPRTPLILTIFSVVVYILLFTSIYYSYGQAMAISATIPVIFVGWFYGFMPGICAGVLSYPVNVLMYILFGAGWLEGMIISGGGIPGTCALILIGAIIGRMRDLSTQIKNHRDKLDELVKRRTEELQKSNIMLEEENNQRKLSDEKLQETKDNLENIIENSLDGIMVTDRTGYATRVNNYFLEMLSYREEEAVGKFVAEFTPFKKLGTYESTTGELVEITKEFADHTNTMIAKLLEEGKATNWEAYYLRKDGKVVPIEQNIVCLYDNEGERTEAVSIIRDITERKKAENELRKTKEYLDNLIESSLDGIVVGDSTGKIIRVNEAFLKPIGYRNEEIKGMHVMELSITEKGTYESTTGETVEINEEFFNDAKKMIYEKLFKVGKITDWKSYYLRKDKKIVPVEMSVAYLYDKEGNIIGSVGINRDITERIKSEKEIKEARDFLENIFKTTTDGIMVTDNEGFIISVNEAITKMLGYSKNELIGKMTGVLHPKGESYKKNVDKYLTILFEEGTVTSFELTYLKKDRNLIDVEVNTALLRDNIGNITGTVSTIRDITERKQDEAQLKETKDHLDNIIESSLDGIIVSDSVGNVIRVNKSFLALVEFEEEEVLGKHIMELSITKMRTYESTTGEMVEINEAFLNTNIKKSVKLFEEGKVSDWESYYLRKDGRIVPVEIKLSHLYDEKGDNVGAVGVIRDITERKKVEKALQRSHEELERQVKERTAKLLQAEKLKSLGELSGGVAHDFNNTLASILGRVQLLQTQFKPPPGKPEKRKSMHDLKRGLEIIERAAIDGSETVRRIQEFSRRRDDDKYFTKVDIKELVLNALEFTQV